MIITSYKTHKVKPGESIQSILDAYLPKLSLGDIVVIASKIIALYENQIVPLGTKADKFALIKQEADYCFAKQKNTTGLYLTLKHGRLLPSAGVDESNCENHYVLLPKNPLFTAEYIWRYLRTKYRLSKLGVLITDSNVTPLRQGVTGIGIAWCGFAPLYNYQGKNDIFGRQLKVTSINILDSLATAATLVMGEGAEQTPLAIIKDVPKICYQNQPPCTTEIASLQIAAKQDLFAPVLKVRRRNYEHKKRK